MTQLSTFLSPFSSIKQANVQRFRAMTAILLICALALTGLYSLLSEQPVMALDVENAISNLPLSERTSSASTLATLGLSPHQSGNAENLVVTQTVYMDMDRYAVNDVLGNGNMTVPVPPTVTMAAGDEILIINMDGVTGVHETAIVSQTSSTTLTLTTPLLNDYDGTVDTIMIQRVPHYNDITVTPGGELTAHAFDGETGGVIFLRAITLTVQDGGTISVNGKGFTTDNGPGSTFQGAGHGGYGEDAYGEGGGQPYGNVLTPIALGSGGSNEGGGTGGGLLRLIVTNALTVNGIVQANGEQGYSDTNWTYTGSGAGGSIWIDAGSIDGIGVIQSNGGAADNNYDGARDIYAGAGGRLSIYTSFDNFTPNGSLQAYGGNDGGSRVAGAGTIYITNEISNGALFVDNNGYDSSYTSSMAGDHKFDTIQLTNFGHLEVTGSLEVVSDTLRGDSTSKLTALGTVTATTDSFTVDGINVDILGQLLNAHDFTIINGGRMQLYASNPLSDTTQLFNDIHIVSGTLSLVSYNNNNTDYTDDNGFTLEANSITVEQNGRISADGYGYEPGKGPGIGDSGFSSARHGSGHGGFGGAGQTTIGNPGEPYGDAFFPITFGSGGQPFGGTGGGAVHVVISNTLLLDGIISANATAPQSISPGVGGASGGSIWVNADMLNGSGSFQATGSNGYRYSNCGQPSYKCGGGGSGGRIQVYVATDNFTVSGGVLNVSGGSGYESGDDGIAHLRIPITNLTVSSSSPTLLGDTTYLTTTIETGSNVSYSWDFGDGITGTGAIVTHTYGTVGEYTAIITAQNTFSILTTTTPIIVELPAPDLVITKTGPAEAIQGGLIIYDIVVSNQSNQAASTVVITDTLPISTTFISSSRDSIFDENNGTVRWEIDFLSGSSTETFNIQIQTDNNISPSQSITNSISAVSSKTDPTPENNQDSHAVLIVPPPTSPDLLIYQSGSANVLTGFPLDYEITVINQGGTLASGIILTDTLPDFTTFAGSNHAEWNTSHDPATGQVVFNLDSLAAGETYQFTIHTIVSDTAPVGVISNAITGRINENEDNITNNNSLFNTDVLAAAAQLTIHPPTSGSGSGAALLPTLENGAATMVITVTNTGTAPLQGGVHVNYGPTGADVNYPWLEFSPVAITSDLPVGASAAFVVTATNHPSRAAGSYYDLIGIYPDDTTVPAKPFYLHTYVHPPLAVLTVSVTNSLADDVPSAQVSLIKHTPSVRFEDGQQRADTYFSKNGTTDSNGTAVMPLIESGNYSYTISAPGHRTETGVFTIISGASQLNVQLQALPGLVFEPEQEVALSLIAGDADYLTFQVRNTGPAVAENFAVETPDELVWVSSGLPYSTTQLAVGEAMSITLFLQPPLSASGHYYDAVITVTADLVDPALLIAHMDVLTAAVSSLDIIVTDGTGAPLEEATVIVTNQNGREVNGSNGIQTVYDTESQTTGSSGTAHFSSLPPADYTYSIQADGYYVESDAIQVQPGTSSPNQAVVQMTPDPFVYNWTVEETTIIDTYAVTVEITYEADVLEPLLYVSPGIFCPGDDLNFIVANIGPITMTDILLTPVHDGVTFTDPFITIGTLAPGDAYTGTFSTSGDEDVDSSGRLNVTAQYHTQDSTFDYATNNKTSKLCPTGGGGGEWTWRWAGGTVKGTSRTARPALPGTPPPPAPSEHEVARLILSGDAALERQAFNARLVMSSLIAGDIQDVTININAKDSDGAFVAGSFAITPTLPTVLGDLTPGNDLIGEWLIVPGDLGITDTNGAVYTLQADIIYIIGGTTYTVTTYPQPITIYPQPFVRLQYSHTQPDSNGDFYVEVSARNDGYGIARNLSLDLSEVTTLGDLDGNGRSLIFTLKEATLDGLDIPLEYVFHYGDLQPGESIVGRWRIGVHASDGKPLDNQVVTGFAVACKHRPYQGVELSPLIDCGGAEQPLLSNNCGPFLCTAEKNATTGYGVNSANGNQNYSQSTPNMSTPSGPMGVEWNYNSGNSGASDNPMLPPFGGPMGNGWTHNFDIHLEVGGATEAAPMAPLSAPATGGQASIGSFDAGHAGMNTILRGPDGTPVVFQRVRDHYEPAPGVFADLEQGIGTNGIVYTVTAHTQAQYIFDSDGKLTQQIDPNGNVFNLEYTLDGQLERVVDSISGRDLDFGYDNQGRLQTVTDPLNRITTFNYSGDLLTSVTDTRQQEWVYGYDTLPSGEQLLSSVTDPETRSLFASDYDAQGRVISQTYQGHTFAIDYYEDGRRIVTDGLGRAATLVYNSQNLLVATQDALGGEERFILDGYNNRIYTQDKLGNPTYANRSSFGYSSDITNALGETTLYDFDPQNNNLLQTTDALSHTTSFIYDGNNLITETNALSQTTSYRYNTYGQVVSMTSSTGSTTGYGYDPLGQLSIITNSIGLTTSYEYDLVGRVITTTDTQGVITINAYDDGDNLTQVTRNYMAGQPQNDQDKYNIITSYGYDNAGNQIAITNTVGQVNLSLYDDVGRVITHVTNYDGVTPFNLLCTDFTNPDPEFNICALTEYNEIGQVVATISSLGRRYVKEYDELGRVVRTVNNWQDGVFDEAFPDEDVEQRTQYDAVGNTTIVTDTLGRMTRHFYDNLNRPAGSIANWSGGINSLEELPSCLTLPAIRDYDICTLYEYNEVGNTIIVTDTMGRMTRTFYDELSRVEATVSNWNPATLASPADCIISPDNNSEENICSLPGYDEQGRHITSTNALGQTSLTVYDEENRPYLTVANWDGITSFSRTLAVSQGQCYPPAQPDVNLCTITLYDEENGRSYGRLDSLGTLSTTGYDDIGRVITTTRYLDGVPINSLTSYDVQGNQITRTDAGGNSSTTAYDSLNRVLATISPEGVAITRTYNAAGQILTTTNNLGNETSTVYDGLGRTVATVDGERNRTEYIYDGAGNKTATIDANGVRTTYLYDDLGRLVTVIENDVTGDNPTNDTDVRTEYLYDATGNRIMITNARGLTSTQTIYDDLNRPIVVEDALGHQAHTEYNALGLRTVFTDANGAVTQYLYDSYNRLRTVHYLADGETVSYAYDALGNRTVMTDSTGITLYQYDDLSRLITVTDSFDQQIGYAYSQLSQRTQLTYPDGRAITYNYDNDYRMETVLDWNGGLTTYQYDAIGRLITTTLPNDVHTVNRYDKANHLLELSHATADGSLLARYEYVLDNIGNRVAVTETVLHPEIVSTTNAFLEENGMLVLEAESGQIEAGSTHSWISQTVQTGYDGDAYLRALPDVGERFTAIESTNEAQATFSMQVETTGNYAVWLRGMAPDAGGDSAYISLDGSPSPAQAVTSFTNEWSWSRQTMSNTQAALSLNNSDAYTLSLSMREDGVRIDKMLLITDTNYIPTGNGPAESPQQIITETTPAELSSHSIQYSYDDLYRLTGAVYGGDITAAYSYVYDSVGNMTAYTETINAETSHISRTFNAANQLISSSGISHTTTYTYDNNGNLISINRDNGNESEVSGYVYNQRNLLTSVNKTIGTGTTQPVADYMYDGSGDRIQQIIYTPSAPATIITYTNDIQGLTQMLVADDGMAITYNVHGLDLISQQAGAGDARLLLADGLGSVRQEMVGDVLEMMRGYGPFGKLLIQSGNSGTVYGFTGEQEDSAGLVYLRARYYNPNLKVFMSRDPFSGLITYPASQHGYSYVHNNPILSSDPSGQCPAFILLLVLTSLTIEIYNWANSPAEQSLVANPANSTEGPPDTIVVTDRWVPSFSIGYLHAREVGLMTTYHLESNTYAKCQYNCNSATMGGIGVSYSVSVAWTDARTAVDVADGFWTSAGFGIGAGLGERWTSAYDTSEWHPPMVTPPGTTGYSYSFGPSLAPFTPSMSECGCKVNSFGNFSDEDAEIPVYIYVADEAYDYITK